MTTAVLDTPTVGFYKQTATFKISTESFKKRTAETNKRTDKYNKQTDKFEQASAQVQAHLQFAQSPPSNQKLQKSLPFYNRTWQVYCTLKVLKNRRLKNKTQLLIE